MALLHSFRSVAALSLTAVALQGCVIFDLVGETVEFAVETTAEAVETVGELTLMAVGAAASAGKSALNSPYETKDDPLDDYYQ